MAINEKQITVYEAMCNHCGEAFEDSHLDYVAIYTDDNQLREAMEAYDWAISGTLCWYPEHDPRVSRLEDEQ